MRVRYPCGIFIPVKVSPLLCIQNSSLNISLNRSYIPQNKKTKAKMVAYQTVDTIT